MEQVLKAAVIKTHLVLRLTSCFLKVQRSFTEKAVFRLRVVLQVPPTPAFPPSPPPRKRSPLISAVPNARIPLHFFEFHFPQQSNYFCHELL